MLRRTLGTGTSASSRLAISVGSCCRYHDPDVEANEVSDDPECREVGGAGKAGMSDSEPELVLAIGSGKGWLPDLDRRMERGFLRMETGRDEVESTEVEMDCDLSLVVSGGTSSPVTSLWSPSICAWSCLTGRENVSLPLNGLLELPGTG